MLNCNNFSQCYCFYCIVDQISIRDFFQILKKYRFQTFERWPFCKCFYKYKLHISAFKSSKKNFAPFTSIASLKPLIFFVFFRKKVSENYIFAVVNIKPQMLSIEFYSYWTQNSTQNKCPYENGSQSVFFFSVPGMLLIYVIIPTIPLLLLILVASGTCCFQMLSKRWAIKIKSL